MFIQSRIWKCLADLPDQLRVGKLVLDVETYRTDPKNGKLLGVAGCFIDEPDKPFYIALQWYDFATSTWHQNPDLSETMEWLSGLYYTHELIGHNYAYDRKWLDHACQVSKPWAACTRLMWHLASAPAGPRGYGLKDAQVELLGWDAKGDVGLKAEVEARGGKLTDGDHYLASLETMGHYACLDAASTAMVYNHLSAFFNEHDYWWMLEQMVEYSWLLEWCTREGIKVDVPALEKQVEILSDTKAAYNARFMELVEPHLQKLERMWREDRAVQYVSDDAKQKFLATWDKQRHFKPSSDKDKRELFYDALKLPKVVLTDGKKPSTGVEAISIAIRESGREDLKELEECYGQAELCETLVNNFAKPWLGSLVGDRLHPGFNPCGTVSYRLSGFKPYMLNAPFDEHGLMSTLGCDPDWGGVHADFQSAEPAVTCHYSQDPSLLKVFKHGLGDVYLDLALVLFPRRPEPDKDKVPEQHAQWVEIEDLHSGYNPNVPVVSEVKNRFKKLRSIAKIIHLAVQYTGTKYTVHKNLRYAGFNMTMAEAELLVVNYWKHFKRVAVMNEALFLKFERQGYLRNVIGRIIRVPQYVRIQKRDGTYWNKPIERYKDLPNRFIQSSAHDLLVLWVLRIAQRVKERGLKAVPVILDCHDSTSWRAPKAEVEALEMVFRETLTELNEAIRMKVELKVDIKRFDTLAGLKGVE